MKKFNFLIFFILIVMLLGCSNLKNNVVVNESISTKNKDMNLKIIVTNESLQYMVKDIIGDRHTVDYMFKDESKIAAYEYSEDSVNNISKQDLFIYVGENYEPWISDFIDKLDKSKVGIINCSRGVRIISYDTNKLYKEKVLADNPYYWLDANNYKIMLINIKNALQEKDPKNRGVYEGNFSKSIKNLEEYKKKSEVLSNKAKEYTFLTSNDNLDYYFKSIDVKVIKTIKSIDNKAVQLNDSDIKALDDKVSKEAASGKKLCFIYEDDKDLEINKGFISKNKLTPIKLATSNGGDNYCDIINYDTNQLISLLK